MWQSQRGSWGRKASGADEKRDRERQEDTRGQRDTLTIHMLGRRRVHFNLADPEIKVWL